jgi:transposase
MAARQNGGPRGHYNQVSNQDRNRIIDAFENDAMDYVQVAETLGVKRQTARSVIVVYLRHGRRDAIPRRGHRPPKVDDDMKDTLQQIVDENPLLTLEAINAELRRGLPEKPAISRSTLARALDGMLLTIKLAEDVPEGRNAERVLQERVDYAQWFLREGVLGHLIYIDECGYNLWTRRSYGRAPRGQPVRRVVNNQRGRNCNCTFAISSEVGLVHHTIRLASTTLLSFQQFIDEMCAAAVQMFPAGDQIFVIYDNARPHVNAVAPPEFNNISVKRLPPYSPFLNPVEMAHSAFKAGVKRALSLPAMQNRVGDRDAATEAGLNMQGWRARLLEEVAAENVDIITPEKCHRWYNHAQTYLPRCIGRQVIDG